VEIVGGTWGQIPLEKKFELAERALYRSSQKTDETSDSYLSRCDVTWTELNSKKVDLKELQAYIVLRGSKLGTDDKKRVIVESKAEEGSQLTMEKVTSAIRLLGSGFSKNTPVVVVTKQAKLTIILHFRWMTKLRLTVKFMPQMMIFRMMNS
jgi:hypothetical protein